MHKLAEKDKFYKKKKNLKKRHPLQCLAAAVVTFTLWLFSKYYNNKMFRIQILIIIIKNRRTEKLQKAKKIKNNND